MARRKGYQPSPLFLTLLVFVFLFAGIFAVIAVAYPTNTVTEAHYNAKNTPTIWFDPGVGSVGTVVNVRGTGYFKKSMQGQIVTLSVKGVTLGTAVVGSDGTFAFDLVTITQDMVYSQYNSEHVEFTVTGAGVTLNQMMAIH